MAADREIIAAWISPYKLKRFFFLNVTVLCVIVFLSCVMGQLVGYELAGYVFLADTKGITIINRIFLSCGSAGGVLGVVITLLGMLGLKDGMDIRRVVTLLAMGGFNIITALYLLRMYL